MAKVKEVVTENEVPEADQEAVPNLTHNAISMCNIPGEGWYLVTFRYNPLTGETGQMTKKYKGEGLAYIKERFKIDTVNPEVLGGLDIFNNSGNPF